MQIGVSSPAQAPTCEPGAPGAPLRFVVLVDDPVLAKWQAACLADLRESGLADLVLVVVNSDAGRALRSTRRGLRRVFGNRELAWKVFNRLPLGRRCAALHPQPDGLPPGIARLLATPIQVGRFRQELEESTLAEIVRARPDFILRFGFGILQGEVLHAARFGIWSFHHGDPAFVRGVPPGFWEIAEGVPVTGVILQRLSEKLDAGQILHRGYFRTVAQSYAMSLHNVLMGAAHFPARVCADLIASGKLPEVPETAPGPVRRAPENRQMMRFGLVSLRNRLGNFIRYRLHRQQWNVAVVDAPIEVVAGLAGVARQADALRSAQWMPETPQQFRADPFAVTTETSPDRAEILFEQFDWRTGLGAIASCAWQPETGFTAPVTVLGDASHYSYPFAFDSDGEPMVLPENAMAGSAKLYAFKRNPGPVLGCSILLIDQPLIDSTILEHDGRYWLFATVDRRSTNSELCLFHASDPHGPWEAHRLNPVKTDVRSARPAGTPFVHAGALYRPAQDCSVSYGGRTVICRIDRLDTDGFAETPVSWVEPRSGGRYPDGLHTVSAMGGRTLIDGCRLTSRFVR